MTAVTKSIKELVENKFWIPAYQRGFRWTRQQIKELIEDLYDFAKNAPNGSNYCLQPIVVRETRKDNIGKCYEVVDGQQRLTALYLIGECYRRINGDDEVTYTDYSLFFEEKIEFQNLLLEIKNPDQTLTAQTIENLKGKYTDIDSQNAIQILLYLLDNWKNTDGSLRFGTKLSIIYNAIIENSKTIFIIWHEMNSNVVDENHVIEAFANVNANKIPLTDAELIKALLLDSYGKFINKKISNDDYEEITNPRMNDKLILEREAKFANQWETIERGLNNEDLWAFFMPNTHAFKTRIEALFDIWYETTENSKINSGEHFLYRAVKEYLDDPINNPEELWKKIINIFETLQDWYNDYRYYHLIGCTSIVSKQKSRTAFAKNLFIEYNNGKTKKEFEAKLREQLTQALCKSLHPKSNGSLSSDELLPTIEGVDYSASDKVRTVLLTFNIALLVNAYDMCEKKRHERFPFGYYKDLVRHSKIDIEHINPKNAEDTSKDIEKTKKLNSLNNLTLLDKTLNITVSNHSFLEKRHIIIEALRGKGKLSESIVFPGTRWVFLREWISNEYESTTYEYINSNIWTDVEGTNYVEFIKNSIAKLLMLDSKNENGDKS